MTPTFFVSETAKIGQRVKIWHFAVILDGVVIGDDVSIGSGSEIGRDSLIGSGTRIGAHCFLPSGSIVGKNVFLGPGVICTDDKYPVVNNPAYNAQPPVIEDWASIGAGAILLPGVRIASRALIGAGSVVCHDVGHHQIVCGEPARLIAKVRFFPGEAPDCVAV